MSKIKMSKNVTIGKIVLSLMAIGVLFVPVYAVQSIEARAIDHALEIEGLYVNGTALEVIDFTNDTRDQIESFYGGADINETASLDSVVMINTPGNVDLIYRDRATYIGNGSYTMTYNLSEEPSGIVQQRKLYFPLNINATELLAPDFVRIQSDWDLPPKLFVTDGGSGAEVYPFHEVSENNYIYVNTIQSRAIISQFSDSQVFLYYDLYEEPTTDSWEVKIQIESYEGADIFTWNDQTLYVVSVLLCDILLVGAIVFASDPIDIKIDRPGKRR